jgi:hypothetical protein
MTICKVPPRFFEILKTILDAVGLVCISTGLHKYIEMEDANQVSGDLCLHVNSMRAEKQKCHKTKMSS